MVPPLPELTSEDSERPTLEAPWFVEDTEQGRLQEELVQAQALLTEQQQTVDALQARVASLQSQLATALEALRRRDQDLAERPPAAAVLAPCEPSVATESIPTGPRGPASLEADIQPQPSAPRPADPAASFLRRVSAALHSDAIPTSSRRKAPRIPCELEVEFCCETGLYAGITADLSEGGLFIATYHCYPLGTCLDLEFELPDGTVVKARGQVRWLRDEVPGALRPGMGVAFVDLSEEALGALTEFSRQHAPLYVEF